MDDAEFLQAAAASTVTAAVAEGPASLREVPKAKEGAVAVAYSPDAMIDLMIVSPMFTPQQFAAHFGRPKSWYYAVLASEAFQVRLSARKSELPDPSLAATLDERFQALTLKSIDVLHERLDKKDVGDQLITKAAEIGIKALGMGQVAAPPPAAPAPASIDQLAERLTQALENQRRNSRRQIAGEVTDVEEKPKSFSVPTLGMTLAELRGQHK